MNKGSRSAVQPAAFKTSNEGRDGVFMTSSLGALLCSLCLLGKTFLDTAAAVVVMVCFLKVRGLYACTHKCAPASKCRVPTSCLSTYHEQDGELDICTTSGVGIMPCHR